MLCTYLAQHGWGVLSSGHPPEALMLLESQPVSHALIDLHLGRYSGLDLIRTITQRWPAVRIVAMTGSILAAHEAVRAAGALAREVVERHGGRIKVESRVDEGTIFSIELPLTAPLQNPSPAPA